MCRTNARGSVIAILFLAGYSPVLGQQDGDEFALRYGTDLVGLSFVQDPNPQPFAFEAQGCFHCFDMKTEARKEKCMEDWDELRTCFDGAERDRIDNILADEVAKFFLNEPIFDEACNARPCLTKEGLKASDALAECLGYEQEVRRFPGYKHACKLQSSPVDYALLGVQWLGLLRGSDPVRVLVYPYKDTGGANGFMYPDEESFRAECRGDMYISKKPRLVFWLNRARLRRTDKQIARTIAHEMIHGLGHLHPKSPNDPEYSNYQIVAFSRAIDPGNNTSAHACRMAEDGQIFELPFEELLSSP